MRTQESSTMKMSHGPNVVQRLDRSQLTKSCRDSAICVLARPPLDLPQNAALTYEIQLQNSISSPYTQQPSNAMLSFSSDT
ncbi:hypothetical protein LshimejAT787_0308250 [Lyophyllum shimeji]|uniref:Uncharacterized protein n=1 Tax=Lyophyllum shimeji TaxID=47721 RepID=A0A9P3UKM3_LYOSH|nr:hypothetical protein LshimejAT787_0308250 [Lyophyllum shimeji]